MNRKAQLASSSFTTTPPSLVVQNIKQLRNEPVKVQFIELINEELFDETKDGAKVDEEELVEVLSEDLEFLSEDDIIEEIIDEEYDNDAEEFIAVATTPETQCSNKKINVVPIEKSTITTQTSSIQTSAIPLQTQFNIRSSNSMKYSKSVQTSSPTGEQACGLIEMTMDTKIFTLNCFYCEKKFPLSNWAKFVAHMTTKHEYLKDQQDINIFNNENIKLPVLEKVSSALTVGANTHDNMKHRQAIIAIKNENALMGKSQIQNNNLKTASTTPLIVNSNKHDYLKHYEDVIAIINKNIGNEKKSNAKLAFNAKKRNCKTLILDTKKQNCETLTLDTKKQSNQILILGGSKTNCETLMLDTSKQNSETLIFDENKQNRTLVLDIKKPNCETLILDAQKQNCGTLTLDTKKESSKTLMLGGSKQNCETLVLDASKQNCEALIFDKNKQNYKKLVLCTKKPNCETLIVDAKKPNCETLILYTSKPNYKTLILDTKKQNSETLILDKKKQNSETLVLDAKKPNCETLIIDASKPNYKTLKLDASKNIFKTLFLDASKQNCKTDDNLKICGNVEINNIHSNYQKVYIELKAPANDVDFNDAVVEAMDVHDKGDEIELALPVASKMNDETNSQKIHQSSIEDQEKLIRFGKTEPAIILEFLDLVKSASVLWYKRNRLMLAYEKAIADIAGKLNDKWNLNTTESHIRTSLDDIKNWYHAVVDEKEKLTFNEYFKKCAYFLPKSEPDNIIACDTCKLLCGDQIELQAHIILRHRGGPPYKCSSCNKTCVDREILEMHETMHLKDKQFNSNSGSLKNSSKKKVGPKNISEFDDVIMNTTEELNGNFVGDFADINMDTTSSNDFRNDSNDDDELEMATDFQINDDGLEFCQSDFEDDKAKFSDQTKLIRFGKTQPSIIWDFLELVRGYPVLWYVRYRHMLTYDTALADVTKRLNEKWGLDTTEAHMRNSLNQVKEWFRAVVKRQEKRESYKNRFHDYFEKCAEFFPKTELISSDSISCHLCKCYFIDETGLEKHKLMRHHVGEPPYKCSQCDRRFVDERNCSSHEAHHVKGPHLKKIHCDKCNKDFRWQCTFNEHRCMRDPNNRRFACNICDKKFLTSSVRNTHQMVIHAEPRFKCELCPKAYHQRYVFEQHMKVHRDQRDYVCEECGRTFVRQKAYMEHKKSVHEGRARCHICNIHYTTHSVLLKHQRTYHMVLEGTVEELSRKKKVGGKVKHLYVIDEVTKQKRIVCRSCGKMYKGLDGLRCHEIREHGYKPKVKNNDADKAIDEPGSEEEIVDQLLNPVATTAATIEDEVNQATIVLEKLNDNPFDIKGSDYINILN